MFTGIRRSYVLLVLFLIEVIEELGTDRGIEMLQTSIVKQADIIEQELRRRIPDDVEPLEKGVLVYKDFMKEAGSEVEVHAKDAESVTFRVDRCPFYYAFLDVGVDCGYFLGNLCTHLTLPAIQETLRRFDPHLRIETMLVRESAEEMCLERIYMEN
jgi:predicted ArsR family transcriptional regulator